MLPWALEQQFGHQTQSSRAVWQPTHSQPANGQDRVGCFPPHLGKEVPWMQWFTSWPAPLCAGAFACQINNAVDAACHHA